MRSQKREGYDVHQYAQRIISTPGKQDGLAWQNDDGTWGGPVGENIARAIAQGYTSRIRAVSRLLLQGPEGAGTAAPLGQIDYVLNGVMIGGFALVAAPAEYGRPASRPSSSVTTAWSMRRTSDRPRSVNS